MNHLKQFADGMKFGLREFKRELFKTIDELEQVDEFGHDGFVRFGVVAITVTVLWPLISFLAEISWRYFQ
jgi:hypothetical protein